MKVEIYEPQRLVMPGITEERKQLKRTVEIIDVKRVDNKYFIVLNDLEAKKAIEFINNNRNSGMSEFSIHIISINKWIISTFIEASNGLLIFTILKENCILKKF